MLPPAHAAYACAALRASAAAVFLAFHVLPFSRRRQPDPNRRNKTVPTALSRCSLVTQQARSQFFNRYVTFAPRHFIQPEAGIALVQSSNAQDREKDRGRHCRKEGYGCSTSS